MSRFERVCAYYSYFVFMEYGYGVKKKKRVPLASRGEKEEKPAVAYGVGGFLVSFG